MKDHELTISKADRGNTVVVIKRSDYVAKVTDFINSNNGTRNTFNFAKYCVIVRRRINNSVSTLLNPAIKSSYAL